jgi:ribosomal protein S18 acetylase RimI-like enzyme
LESDDEPATVDDGEAWTIRLGGEADVLSVPALWQKAESPTSATDTEQALGRLIDHDPDSLFLAEASGEVIGSLIVAWDGWRGSFYRLAVHPGWRRRGIATALVRAGEERLRKLGAVRLTAIVVGNELAAAALWEAEQQRRLPGGHSPRGGHRRRDSSRLAS